MIAKSFHSEKFPVVSSPLIQQHLHPRSIVTRTEILFMKKKSKWNTHWQCPVSATASLLWKRSFFLVDFYLANRIRHSQVLFYSAFVFLRRIHSNAIDPFQHSRNVNCKSGHPIATCGRHCYETFGKRVIFLDLRIFSLWTRNCWVLWKFTETSEHWIVVHIQSTTDDGMARCVLIRRGQKCELCEENSLNRIFRPSTLNAFILRNHFMRTNRLPIYPLKIVRSFT